MDRDSQLIYETYNDSTSNSYADGFTGVKTDHYDGKHWYVNGLRHRDGSPALIHSDGETEWYQHGKLSREDGPAVEWPGNDQMEPMWYFDDKLYRTPELWAAAILSRYHKPYDTEAVNAYLRPILQKQTKDLI